MPKARLEFNLPEEQEEFKMTCKAVKYFSVIFDFDNKLRSIIKHDDSISEEACEIYEKVHQILWDEIKNNDVSDDF